MEEQVKSTGEWRTQLLKAAKNGDNDVLQHLLISSYFTDINLIDKDGHRAIDYAWDNKHFKFVLSLLINDSVFPVRFDLNQSNDNDEWEGLKEFVKDRNLLHKYVKDGNLDEIRRCCESIYSKFYLNSDNETLLLTAVKNKQLVTYHFLLSIGVNFLNEDEKRNVTELIEKSVIDNLKEFVTYFVTELEAKLHLYHLILEGEIKKAGRFSKTYSKAIGLGIGGAAGSLIGLLLGIPGEGAKLGAAGGKTIAEKVGTALSRKHHKKKVITVKDLIDRARNDKANFRRELIEDGFEIFQSYEVQFMNVTTAQGPQKAMQLLARDATNRLISYYGGKNCVEGKNVIEGIVLGKSKLDYKLPIISDIIRSHGFSLDTINSPKKKWSTAGLYENVGLVREGAYYEKKDKSEAVIYGYRCLLNSEDWNKLKGVYKRSELESPIKNCQHVLISEDLELKITITKKMLEEINSNDRGLMEVRMKNLIEEVITKINILHEKSQRYTEDREVLTNIQAILEGLKVEKFEQHFEEAKKEREEIGKSIKAGQKENSENFNQINQKLDIYYEDNMKTLEKIQDCKTKATEKPIWFDVKDPVKSFTKSMRKKELDDLHSKIQRNPERTTVITHITAISGLGGIGKTELARRYVQDHSNDFENVIWINSESEATLIESFSKLAKDELQIETKDENGKEINIQHIAGKCYLNLTRKKSLFIFDNADNDTNFRELLRIFRRSLAPPYEKPYILITSRNQDWESGIEIYNLNVLTLQDAADLVKTNLNGDDKEIKALIEKLHCFPLAIQQAIAYIEDQRVTGEYSISNYLEEYEKKTIALLDSEIFMGIDNEYERTTFTTWKITIDKIAGHKELGQLASDILNCIAYLAPENIKREMFLVLTYGNQKTLMSAVRLLVKYSMINGEEKQSVLNIHRLVQEVVRLELQGQNLEEKVLTEVRGLIVENFPYVSDRSEDYPKKRQLLPHLETFTSHIDQWIKRKPQNRARIEKNFLEILLIFMSHGYGELGDHQKEKELLEKALTIEQKHYGSDHFQVARTLVNLGNAYGSLGDPQKEKELFEKALTIEQKHYGSDHFEVARTLVNLGNAYGSLGDPQKEKELFEKALTIQEKHYGSDHFEVARTLVNLGNAYGSLGDSQRKKELLEKALTIQKKHYGSDHFEVAATLGNLGIAYGSLGDHQKKKELLKKALTIKEKHYGSDHYEVATTLGYLGNAYGSLGDHQKKKELLKKALTIQEKHYGSDHFEVARTLVNLGNAYGSLGDPQKQTELLEKALTIQEKHYGSDYFELGVTLLNLGNAYGSLGDPQKQKELLEKALTIQEKHYGSDHFQVARTLGNLGIAYGFLGDPQKQKELLEKALTIQEKHYGSDHYEVASTLVNLGNAYGSLGDPQKQKELLEKALIIEQKHYGSDHYEVATTLVHLGNAYSSLGDPQKQKELLAKALTIQEKHYGSDYFELGVTLLNLGNAYGSLGDPQKQKELLENALTIQEKHYGSDHYEVATTLVNLGNAYGSLGDPQKQKELLEKALTIQKKHYGSDHFEVAATLGNLGIAYGFLGDPQKQKELLEKALTIKEKHYGSDHYEVARTLVNLGNAYGSLGDPQKEKELLEKALTIEQKHYGSDHYEVATTLVNLGNAYSSLGDPQKQKELLEKALAIKEKHYGSDHFKVATTLENLGNAYGSLGDPQKQKELFEKALTIKEKHYGSDHYEVATTLVILGNAYGVF